MPEEQAIRLRVFISSPGDVDRERKLARRVLEDVQHNAFVEGQALLESVLWDARNTPVPLSASERPQTSVNRYKGEPSECHLTLVILWSKMGSPPGPDFLCRDGTPAASGTEWEFENALQGRGDVWVYRRISEPETNYGPEQRASLRRFFDRLQAEGRSITGTFARPAEFERKFRAHIEMWLARHQKTKTSAAKKPFVVPRFAHDYPIVGRDEIVEEIWSLLLARKSASLHFLPGVGKTTLALRLLSDRERVLTHFDGVLWANVGRRPDTKAVLREWALALSYTADQCNGFGTEDSAWHAAIRAAIAERHFLIVLDDVFDEEFASLFVGLAPASTFVLTTRKRGRAFSDLLPNGEKRAVPTLSSDMASELLAALALEAVEAFPDMTVKLIDAVDGLPLALLLAGKHLANASGEGGAKLKRAFERMLDAGERFKTMATRPNGEFRSMAEIIEVSYRALDAEPDVQAGFRALGIFRPKPHTFDEQIAGAVCSISGDVIDRLSDGGLIEYFGGDGHYTMHRVIAQFARTKLEKERSDALHRDAARYYEERLKAQAGANRGEYLYWYRYEMAEWQSLMDARLYHLSHAGNGEVASLAFVQRYFDAFWWWGYYQRFEFCDQMLVEWKRRKIRADFLQCLHEIERFETSYATGYKKEGEGNWGEVRGALESIRTLLQVGDGGANLANKNGQRVHAFTGFFLAEAYAYGEREAGKAFAAYTVAHEQFLALGEPWVAAWIQFYVAQFHYELGNLANARDYCNRGLIEAGQEKPVSERDPELLSNLRRLQGDLALADGNGDAALVHYAAASLHAWIFQGIPADADRYTMMFYREVIEARIASRLAELVATQPDLVLTLCLRLVERWAPARSEGTAIPTQRLERLLARGDPGEIAAAIFPAPLPEEELLAGALAYGARVRELAASMEARFATLGADA